MRVKKPAGRSVSLTIRLDEPVWRAVRTLAEDRTLARGGRASVVGTIRDLIAEALAKRKTVAAR